MGHTSKKGVALRPDIQVVAPDNTVHVLDFTTNLQANKIFKYDPDMTSTLMSLTYD